MNRKQRIDKILSNNFENFLLEIVDNSNLHKGHNNFTGNNETHIKIILTKCKPPITGFDGKVSIVRILENN